MTLVKTMGGSRSAQERHVLPATVDVKMAATRSPIQFRSPLAVSATVSTDVITSTPTITVPCMHYPPHPAGYYKVLTNTRKQVYATRTSTARSASLIAETASFLGRVTHAIRSATCVVMVCLVTAKRSHAQTPTDATAPNAVKAPHVQMPLLQTPATRAAVALATRAPLRPTVLRLALTSTDATAPNAATAPHVQMPLLQTSATRAAVALATRAPPRPTVLRPAQLTRQPHSSRPQLQLRLIQCPARLMPVWQCGCRSRWRQ